MKGRNKLIRVYSGTEILAISLKDKLEKEGIQVIIQNDSADSFLRGVPIAIDLYILESDFEKAEPIINEFLQDNKV
jgi:hypothetical protein